MNRLFSIVLLSFFLTGCGASKYVPDMPDFSLPSIPLLKPYKADVNQGSVLSRFTINQLKTGMSKHQVQDIIGHPSIIDPFHNNQWDYVHHTTLGSNEIIRYRLTLTFKGDKLININTDGITSLAEMTDKEKAQEKMRIAEEIISLKRKRIAKEKARVLKEKARALEEKARALEEKARALEVKRIAKEKARILKEKVRALEVKRQKEEKPIVKEEVKVLKEKNESWYKFW